MREARPRFRLWTVSALVAALAAAAAGHAAEVITDDFEETAVGAAPKKAVLRTEADKGPIVVTDETAAQGKRSLKLVDHAGLKLSWHPHFFYKTNIDGGTVRCSFAFRRSAGSDFLHEWRLYGEGGGYVAGPSLRVLPNGALIANGRRVDVIPADRWTRLEIEYSLASEGKHLYTLTVAPEGKQGKNNIVPVEGDALSGLDWIGFISPGKEGVTYIDDLKLETSTGGFATK